MKATKEIAEWSQERVIKTQNKLIQMARHSVKVGQPNLLSESEASDLSVMIDSFEEMTNKIEDRNGLEDLPEMTQEQVDAPSSDPVEVVGEFDPELHAHLPETSPEAPVEA